MNDASAGTGSGTGTGTRAWAGRGSGRTLGCRRALASLAALVVLGACGGGGGGAANLAGSGTGTGTGGGSGSGSGAPAPPFITGSVFAFPAGGALPSFAVTGASGSAAAQVADRQGGTPIETATVLVNTIALPYSATSRTYGAPLTIAPGEPVSVAVTIGATTYSAGGRMPTDYPVIVEPLVNATWSAQAPNEIRWTAAAPTASSQFLVAVFDGAGRPVWPANGTFASVPRTQTSLVVPAGVLGAGTRNVVVGIGDLLPLPGAAAGSGFLLTGNRYVPVTVAGP
jgi:hypothetical protein